MTAGMNGAQIALPMTLAIVNAKMPVPAVLALKPITSPITTAGSVTGQHLEDPDGEDDAGQAQTVAAGELARRRRPSRSPIPSARMATIASPQRTER